MMKKTNQKNKIYQLKNKQGFSLVEIIIYVAITTILVTVVTSFGVSAFRMKTKNQEMFLVEAQGVSVMQKILSTARNSKAILNPTSGSASSLGLNIDDITKDPTVFNWVGDSLTIREGNDVARDMLDPDVKVSNFQVENLSRANTNGNVRISVTLSGNNYEKTFYGNATIR